MKLSVRFRMLVFATGACLLLLIPAASAQVTTGTISGAVKDSTGAVLPGAKIVLLSEDTGSSRTVETDSAGRYSAAALGLGNYRVTATHDGFQAVVRSGIVLTLAREAVVDLTMTVGAVTQSVEVTGEAPIIETTSSTVSGLVNQEQMRGLPLNGRSFADLALLSPGALLNFSSDSNAAQGFSPRLSINGSRNDANLYLLDGTAVGDASSNSSTAAGLSLGVEGIREFRILTHNFTAEYGRNSGSVISAVTRSGTNRFQGSAYEFVRNNIFDARNFFNPGDLPAFRRNQFGVALGGPVLKDRIFFFVNYEGLRQRQGISAISNVPDLNARQGLLPDPTTGQLHAVTFNPVIIPYLALYPLPNGRNFGDGTAQSIVNFKEPTDEDYSMERMDFRLSDKDNVYWRYVFDPSTAIQPFSTPTFKITYGGTNHFATMGETHVFSATALNEFRFAFNRTSRSANSSPAGITVDPSLSFVPGLPLGTIRYASLGSGFGATTQLTELGNSRSQPQLFLQNLFQATNAFSIVKGAHALKFGVDVERPQFNSLQGTNFKGVYQFNGIADLLAGKPTRFDAVNLGITNPERGWRRIYFGWFLQDDFRLSSRLTLNLGFRHEFYTNPTEVNGRSANLIQITDAQSTLGPPFESAKANFAPRVGLAWDPTGSGKTSIRAGAGVFYNQIDGRTWQSYSQAESRFLSAFRVKNPPFPQGTPSVIPSAAQTTSTVEFHLPTPTVIHYGVEVQRQFTSTTSLQLGYIGSYGYNMTRGVAQNLVIPTIMPDGSKFFPAGGAVVNPGFADISQLRADATDNYNALQMNLQKSVSAGLRFQAAYTWSHALSQSDASTNSQVNNVPADALDKDNLARDYGRSGYDQRHTFVFNSEYRMPWDKRLSSTMSKDLLGGWAINGIFKASSGLPFNVQLGYNASQDGDSNQPDRPNVAPGASNNPIHGVTAGCGPIKAGQKLSTPDLWYDPCAFQPPTPGTFGFLGRNTVQGPGFYNIDFALVKNTRLRERMQLEFRAEFFNLFNHANFAIPNQTVLTDPLTHSGSEGVIISTVNPGRQIQLGLKLVF